MSRLELATRAAALAAADTPFVWATVVRAARPTSAKPGDAALVHPDGRIDGFVGGECAEATVRAQALQVLTSGRSRLLRITPEAGEAVVHGDDEVVTVHNSCLSGGTLEIFLEPSRPLPEIGVFGNAPIAAALLRADRVFGQHVRALPGPDVAGLRAVVVASHGTDEAAVLEAALQADVPYVGLVASRRRGAAVVAGLNVGDAQRARVHTPAGLDIGARSPAEVALSVLAEIVADSREPRGGAGPTAAPPATAVDPVCGMSVAAVAASLFLGDGDERVYFCGPGCRDAYRADPAAYPGRLVTAVPTPR